MALALKAGKLSEPVTRPRILFLGSMYAGHRTRFLNLMAHSQGDPRIRPVYRQVTGWVEGGIVERAPLAPPGLKGRVRAVLQARALATLPRPDAIWCSAGVETSPFLWSQLAGLRRPLVLDLDATFEQLDAMAPLYFRTSPKRGVRRAVAGLLERALWQSTTVFTPWSNWAADSLRCQGVAGDRIRVLPPGVDLDQWRPRPELRDQRTQRLRLLFVGGDFDRKGGRLLLNTLRAGFAEQCTVDIVTHDAVCPSEGIRVHRAEPNSTLLRDLYARADLFVLPTRAECFGIATIEAMASGLPVIMGDVGGARDIVDSGTTGWLIEPTERGLAAALHAAVAQRDALPAMGAQARRVAEGRFDGKRNDALVVDLLLDECARHRGV